MKTLIPAFALALLGTGTALAGTTYRVGTGCAHATIQDAVDAIPNGGSGIIRIRSGTYNERVTITNKTVDLFGGHADCATTNAPGVSHLDASGGTAPGITFFVIAAGAGDGHTLSTDKLNLFNGTGNVLARGGGVSVYTDADRTATVTLQRTFVRDNQTEYHGGGIALYGNGGGTLTLLENSQLENNAVTGDDPYGGGLYCAGDYDVVMIGGSIHGNSAGESGDSNARGGGIYLDGCDMAWFAQSQTAATDDAALRGNIAHGGGALSGGHGGGGLYARGGAQVDLIGAHFVLFGDPASSRPLLIHGNEVQATSGEFDTGSGSAVFASGSGTRVRLDRTWVYANDSDSRGAFYALGGAEIIVERGSDVCHTPKRCSRVFDNTAAITAVAFAHGNSVIRFRRTIVSGNTGTGFPVITSVFENQFGGTIEVDDSLIYGNAAYAGFHVYQEGSPTLHLRRSTVAANAFTHQVARLSGENTTVRIWDSIIHEPGTPIAEVSGDPDIGVDCVVWHDDQLGGSRTLVADPLFADPDHDLFYLQPDSPAINFCDIAPPAPGVDLDWNARGICHSTDESCGAHVYDLGAYEFPLAIFSDRFED